MVPVPRFLASTCAGKIQVLGGLVGGFKSFSLAPGTLLWGLKLPGDFELQVLKSGDLISPSHPAVPHPPCGFASLLPWWTQWCVRTGVSLTIFPGGMVPWLPHSYVSNLASNEIQWMRVSLIMWEGFFNRSFCFWLNPSQLVKNWWWSPRTDLFVFLSAELWSPWGRTATRQVSQVPSFSHIIWTDDNDLVGLKIGYPPNSNWLYDSCAILCPWNSDKSWQTRCRAGCPRHVIFVEPWTRFPALLL